MKAFFKAMVILFLLIALPLVAFVLYLIFTLASVDKDSSEFANRAMGQIAQSLEVQPFLDVAAPRYEVSLLQQVSAADARDASHGKNLVAMAGGTPGLVKQTFDMARQQLGAIKKSGTVTCRKTMGLIMCFGDYDYERSGALMMATLQKADATYKIQEFKIVPIK